MARRTRYEKVRAARRHRRESTLTFGTTFQFSSTPHLSVALDDIPWGFRYLSRRTPGPRTKRGPKRLYQRYCLPRAFVERT